MGIPYFFFVKSGIVDVPGFSFCIPPRKEIAPNSALAHLTKQACSFPFEGKESIMEVLHLIADFCSIGTLVCLLFIAKGKKK